MNKLFKNICIFSLIFSAVIIIIVYNLDKKEKSNNSIDFDLKIDNLLDEQAKKALLDIPANLKYLHNERKDLFQGDNLYKIWKSVFTNYDLIQDIIDVDPNSYNNFNYTTQAYFFLDDNKLNALYLKDEYQVKIFYQNQDNKYDLKTFFYKNDLRIIHKLEEEILKLNN